MWIDSGVCLLWAKSSWRDFVYLLKRGYNLTMGFPRTAEVYHPGAMAMVVGEVDRVEYLVEHSAVLGVPPNGVGRFILSRGRVRVHAYSTYSLYHDHGPFEIGRVMTVSGKVVEDHVFVEGREVLRIEAIHG